MQNLSELCFNQVHKDLKEPEDAKKSEERFNNCIHRHMFAFKLVVETINNEAKSLWLNIIKS